MGENMDWFKRDKQGLVAQKKKNLPEGIWLKCEKCNEILYNKELERNLFVCMKCGFHFRIGSSAYIEFLLDNGEFEEFNVEIRSRDPLKFKDTKRYSDRIKEAMKKTSTNEAIRTGVGKINERSVVLCVMEFSFVGGSMGSVVGEKVARAIDKAIAIHAPLIIVSASGGARMQEGALSLMQMAKTSARLTRLADARLPFISIVTNPTTGGTTASYTMLGDVIIAEPGALIGFAGPRVIKQTIGQDLPDGFQSSEFLLQHGFVDAIVARKELKTKVWQLLEFMSPVVEANATRKKYPEFLK